MLLLGYIKSDGRILFVLKSPVFHSSLLYKLSDLENPIIFEADELSI